MKTCRDCIHYEVCGSHCEKQSIEGCSTCMLKLCNHLNSEDCPNFKDISKIVELPCSIGTTLYKIYNYVHPCSLYRTCKNEHYCKDLHNCPNFSNGHCDSRIEFHLVELPNAQALNILMSQKDFGTKVFLTKEDAERKVRELNGEM